MRSLSARVLLLISGVLMALAAITAAIAFTSHRTYAIEMEYDRASSFVDRLVDAYPWIWERYRAEPGQFGDVLRQFILLEPDTGLYLLDPEGRVLASAGEGRIFWSTYRVDLRALRDTTSHEARMLIHGDDPDTQKRDSIVAGRPIFQNDVERGWLYVVSRASNAATGTTSDEQDMALTYARRAIVKIVLVTLVVGGALSLGVVTLLTRPLAKLTRATERIKRSGFAVDGAPGAQNAGLPHLDRPDEIGRLARTFRDVFDLLRQEAENVRKTDVMRREMVLSVSHDLRTPLTALIGQLDTIRMKGDRLSDDERTRFFDGAWQNAGQLRRLTDSLLDISRLDSPEIVIRQEPTAIGELLDDIAQRYRSRADEARVSLDVVYDNALPLCAVDAGLLERAIGNLVDNALRVTPGGGRIALAAVAADQWMKLQVTDTGPGVPEADVPRVFDRFYQGSAARELRGSSGLGLAIVKRIAELHNGEVGLVNGKDAADIAFHATAAFPGHGRFQEQTDSFKATVTMSPGATFWITVPLA